MASNPAGDIPGARFAMALAATHASAASNGATARGGQFGPFGFGIRPTAAFWCPTGADATGSSSATYRNVQIINGGTAGTGTTVVASLALSASLASLGQRAMVVDTTQTVASNEILYFKQVTVGSGDHANCVMPAGQVSLAYEIL